jgi:L-lactate dehydrogenase complex protein LldG
MTERDKIFARIREALAVPAPHPGAHDSAAAGGHEPGEKLGSARQWLPPTGRTFEEQIERFRTASTELKTNFVLLPDRDALGPALLALRDTEGWKRMATHRSELTDFATTALQLPTLYTDAGYDVAEMERCDIGLTCCDALVAQTGSVVVTNSSAGGRALSVLPPHHVVLARRDQLVPDLTAAFALVKAIYGRGYPSMISVVSGPSRTGDIERILVLGAHGPRKLTIFCL